MLRRAALCLRRAVALDIDGVLIRGRTPIPGARRALELLEQHQVPYVLLTNGWGSEARKADQVSQIVGHPVDAARVIVAHTPMRDWDDLKHKRILLSAKPVGVDAVRNYGYEQAVWSTDHMTQFPKQTPLRHKPWVEEPCTPLSLKAPCVEKPYDAVAVVGEPADWYAELQLITDALRTDPKTMELTDRQHIPLYWFNDDLTFAGDHPSPRLAGGALLVCLTSLFKELTGRALQVTKHGKPHAVQYRYVEKVLGGMGGGGSVRSIMCVGDNLRSDIEGANGAGDHFTSVLVLSGIQAAAPEAGQVPVQHLPDLVYPDVEGFVEDFVRAEAQHTEEAAAGGGSVARTVTVVTGEHCPLCEDGLDLLDGMGIEAEEVALSSLSEEEQERHRRRIPVFLHTNSDGVVVEVGHGRITRPALEWKLRKHAK